MPAEATRAARHPLALYLLGLCVVSGVLAATATLSGQPAESPDVATAVPAWARLVWYGLLVGGAGVALVGVCWPHRRIVDMVTGLLWERRGVAGLAAGAALYGATLGALDGPAGKVSGAVTLGFALACIARVRGIRQDLERIRAILREPS